MLLLHWLAFVVSFVYCKDLCPVANTFDYHTAPKQTVRSFQGIYHSNYNETITFCNFKPKSFELNAWDIIPVLAQTSYGSSVPFTDVGAVLTGAVYIAANGSVVWYARPASHPRIFAKHVSDVWMFRHGFGFSATGPYNCAFALSEDGKSAAGYYTYTSQKHPTTPAGETGPWLLTYTGEDCYDRCRLVYRSFTAEDYETGCSADGACS